MSTALAGQSIRDLIDQRAAETPDAVFAIDPGSQQSVTYAELQESAEAVSHLIASMGPEPGETVGYAMTNGANTAKVILGILYGGYIATAINLVAGSKTIAYVLEHSAVRMVFCEEDTKPGLETAVGDKPHALFMVVEEGIFHGHMDPAPDHRPSATDDGLLMYTSGTTGVPKGVVLTHGNLIAGGSNTMHSHELSSSDKGLCVLPLYHINGLCVTVLGALVSGGCVIIPHKFSVRQFWSHVLAHHATWFSVVPTQISYLLQDAETNGAPDKMPRLRFGRSASAPLAPEVHRAFEQKFNIPIIETMGLTETAAQILSNPLPPGKCKIGSPGMATGNEILIGDDQQKEVARGDEGEVLVRGPNIMRCYLKNPEATREAITPNGWLRTGDLGRMDEDGYVFITGRLKELIIKGGENIAPREIDDVLYTHPDVVEAAAFARANDQYGQCVEAGVMLKSGSTLSADDLISLCREQLGPFKAPDKVHFFPELPKGPSGKIQRMRLAELTGTKAPLQV